MERVCGGLPNPSLVLSPESVHLLDQPRAGSVRISVTDSGVGLTADQLAQICTEGMQFNANELQAGKGSGLGLFITKGIVEQHGGTLTVTSPGIGEGTRFAVELPLFYRASKPCVSHAQTNRVVPDSAPPVPAPPSPALSDTYSKSLSGSGLDSTESPRRILVVDDAASNRKMLTRVLASKGYECVQADDGQQAIDRYVESVEAHTPFYSIIMDFEMPVMNGPTSTGHLRAMGCTVPIIGVTGNLLPNDITFFKVQGANEVLGKPLNISRFEEFMREHEEHCEHVRSGTPAAAASLFGDHEVFVGLDVV